MRSRNDWKDRDIDESMVIKPPTSRPVGATPSGRLKYSPGRTRDDPEMRVPPWYRETSPAKSMKKGGVVKKTGAYRLHKGERVVPRARKR